ncbi:hypothetical protein [Nocardia sp. NBC_01329]|nr:hypothetical protein OG405_19655 [Nocardia sp. NBC_01329]
MSGARPAAAAYVTPEGVDRSCPENNNMSGARPEAAACVITEVAV